MRRVFVSYNSIDRPRTVDVVRDLEAAGYEAWFDQDLTGGQEWWDVILDEIRASDAVVVAVTEHALESAACRAEWQYAVELGKAIVPLQLEDTSIDLAPSSLQHRQWVDYRTADKQAAFSLVKAVNSAQSAPLPDPLPVPPPLPLTYVAELRQQLESTAPLALHQQLTIVFQLRERLHGGGDPRAIEQLLRRFRSRDDLLAAVAPDVEQLLTEARALTGTAVGTGAGVGTGSSRQSTSAPPPPPPRTGGPTHGTNGGGGRTPSAWLRPPRAYLLVGAAAAVVAAVLIGVIAAGDDDDDSAGGTTTSAQPSGSTSAADVTTSSAASSPGTATSPSTPCDPAAGQRCITIDEAHFEADALVIEWTAVGFDPSVDEFHAHFFLSDIAAAQAGNNAADFGFEKGYWELTDARPYRTTTLLTAASGGPWLVDFDGLGFVPGLCVTVGTAPFHNVLDPNQFTCVPLPA
ncbi:MAG: toll/interleukin-1 receptor domain-containing protein [Acidimicrobiia bacterium]